MKFDYTPYLNIFLKYGFAEDSFWEIVRMYRQPHRHYHTEEHLQDVLKKIEIAKIPEEKSGYKGMKKKEMLVFAAFFHDCVYDIKDPLHNEVLSEKMFRRFRACVIDGQKFSRYAADCVSKIIWDTQWRTSPEHKSRTTRKLSKIFWDIDNSVLDSDFSGLLRWERQIFKEYQAYNFSTYREARIEFLENEIDRKIKASAHQSAKNLQALKEYVANFVPKIGVYVGSFNPFHVGHYNILTKAEKLFDKVILVRGINPEKKSENISLAEIFPEAVHNRELLSWEKMTHEFLKELEEKGTEPFLIRGLRNGTDLDFEVTQLRFMEEFYPDVKVVYLQCDKEYEHVSSSAIRSIKNFDETKIKRYTI